MLLMLFCLRYILHIWSTLIRFGDTNDFVNVGTAKLRDDSPVNVDTDVRRVQNLGREKISPKNLMSGQKVLKI